MRMNTARQVSIIPRKSVVSSRQQRGVGTLATSLMILFLMTAMTLYTAKTVLIEQNIIGNQVRTEQAFAAADAALDFGRAWYNGGEEISTLSSASPFVSDANGSSTDGGTNYTNTKRKLIDDDVTTADPAVKMKMYFCDPSVSTFGDADIPDFVEDPERCTTVPANTLSVGIVAIGYSADGSAKRVLTQKVGNFSLLNPPIYAVSAKGNVEGNINVINRYKNATIIAGGSSSLSTYILNPDYTRGDIERLENPATPASEVDLVLNNALTTTIYTDNDKGVVVNQRNTRYSAKTNDEFFGTFFKYDKVFIEAYAATKSQVVIGSNCANTNDSAGVGLVNGAKDSSGIFWVNGNCTLDGQTVGSEDSPVIVVVEGNLTFKKTTGVATNFYGVIYVISTYNAGEGGTIHGAVIVEGETVLLSGGNGNTTIVYNESTVINAGGNTGAGGSVAGTWKDF